MKPYLILDANIRETGKKSLVKALLKNDRVPGVIYFKNKENACISLQMKDMIKIVNDPSGLTRLYEINYGNNKVICILKEVQFNPVTDTPRSCDFMEVSSGDIVKVNVPIRVLNKEVCPGVKNGGDIYMLAYNVDLLCNVENIPYAIEVDVKNSNMGQKFFLSDIKLPEGCRSMCDVILLRVAGKRVMKDVVSSQDANAVASNGTEAQDGNATTTSTNSNK